MAEVVCCACHGANIGEGHGPWSEGSTPVDLVCDTIPGEICNMQEKKEIFLDLLEFGGIKNLCYKTAILIRLVVEKNGTQKKSTLWFKTTSNNWQVNHFTTFSCLGPHTHLKMPLSSWAPKALPFIFLRCNPGGVWKDPPAPDWVALSPELHLLMCLDESRLWP